MIQLYSMTGYGRETLAIPQKKITVELKSLNSKQADIMLKAPTAYSELEMDIRSLLNKHLKRGKIYCQINVDFLEGAMRSSINHELASIYLKELKSIERDNQLEASNDYLSQILRLPDVVSSRENELKEEEAQAVIQALNLAIERIKQFRKEEGEILADDFNKRITAILKLLKEIAPLEEQRIVNVRERLTQEVQKNMQKLNVDSNRFEQELIFYLEKLDITEEKIRLEKHCQYFLETMNGEQEEKGKKLGFVSQEIGREINTLGSKANDAAMQKIVVQMKDELEKIKEQLLNIL